MSSTMNFRAFFEANDCSMPEKEDAFRREDNGEDDGYYLWPFRLDSGLWVYDLLYVAFHHQKDTDTQSIRIPDVYVFQDVVRFARRFTHQQDGLSLGDVDLRIQPHKINYKPRIYMIQVLGFEWLCLRDNGCKAGIIKKNGARINLRETSKPKPQSNEPNCRIVMNFSQEVSDDRLKKSARDFDPLSMYLTERNFRPDEKSFVISTSE